MVLFRLRSQQTGQTRDFSLLDILKALGDTTNDELRLPDGNREDVFNLSSFQDMSSRDDSGTMPPHSATATKLVSQSIKFVHGQRAFYLGAEPVGLCAILRNGIHLTLGLDYDKDGLRFELVDPLIATEVYTETLTALYDVPVA